VHRIVFLDRSTLPIPIRRPSFQHTWVDFDLTPPERVRERLDGATIAVTNKVRLGRDVLETLPELRMIAVAATGMDIIDLDVARSRGIHVANIKDYATRSVPEHALMLMLALSRNLLAYRADVETGVWHKATTFCLFTHPVVSLNGATLGIIGYGALGRATAELCARIGMRVLIAEHKGTANVREGRSSFDRVIEESDVISLHASLNDETRGLIGKSALSRMKPTAILINTARGGLVDDEAVADAIEEGRIGAVGFDVLKEEPPRSMTRLLELARRPNVIITPHIAWASQDTMRALADRLVDNIEAFVRSA
jgi:glycerate dehydrogenase